MEDLQNMTMNDQDGDDDDDGDDEEDVDDIQLRDSDALIVVAKTEEDFASLEVNIFDARSSNLYVHHDIPLPSYPLCLALGCVVSSDNDSGTARAGNYVAVGSFEPHIEVWNLDVMNALEPTLVLGGMDTRGAEEDWMRMRQATKPSSTTIGSGKMQKKKKKTKNGAGGRGGKGGTGLRDGSHTDAVMGLSWNTVHRQVLASASADCTVKLWDVTQTHGDYIRPSATLTHHTDKVQSLAWHPTEGTLLATGGYDRRVCLVDARSAAAVSTANNANQSVKTAKLLADCEALAWDPHNQQYLTAASEDGTVQCWDVRKFGLDPVWSFVAHEYGGVSDITYNA
jgi:periodic tryptophan protein 1